jgi:predicted nuclease of predicted toxin-antitoxin system
VRFYLDQMLGADLAEILRSHGHDVVRTAERGQDRADDALIIERAVSEERAFVTIDGHFGDWAVLPLSEHFGVIRVKARPTTTTVVSNLLLPFLIGRSQMEFRNQLMIISPSRVRWIRTA